MLPTLRADLAMCETYVYRDEPPLDCPISAYGGENDAKIPAEHLAPWKVQTTSDFQLRMFPGNHFFFLQDGGAAVLQSLRDELEPHTRSARNSPVISSRASVEQTIASVWREVLGVQRVGPDENFFDLGGTSLLMVQAHCRLQQSVNTSLSLLDLFRYPTIRLLAAAIAPEASGGRPFGAADNRARGGALSTRRHRALRSAGWDEASLDRSNRRSRQR